MRANRHARSFACIERHLRDKVDSVAAGHVQAVAAVNTLSYSKVCLESTDTMQPQDRAGDFNVDDLEITGNLGENLPALELVL